MASLLTDVSLVATSLFGIVTTAVTTVTSNPLLLMFFSIAVVGAGVGLFQRLRG